VIGLATNKYYGSKTSIAPGAIAGIVIGVVAFVVIAFVGICCLCRKKSNHSPSLA
jgi:hypothetical protein